MSLTRLKRVKEVSRKVEEGEFLSDGFFDQLYPESVRVLSHRHWTPAEIAIRVARLLGDGPEDRVLDIGAGVGKFVVLGALSTRASYVGVETREELVEVGKNLIEEFALESRADLLKDDVFALDWEAFTGFYLYNPFYEYIANDVDGMGRFEYYVRGVQDRLRKAKAGTKVAVLIGFGGGIPNGYRRVLKEQVGQDFLELWVKT